MLAAGQWQVLYDAAAAAMHWVLQTQHGLTMQGISTSSRCRMSFVCSVVIAGGDRSPEDGALLLGVRRESVKAPGEDSRA